MSRAAINMTETSNIISRQDGYGWEIEISGTKRTPVDGSKYDDVVEYKGKFFGNTIDLVTAFTQLDSARDKLKESLSTITPTDKKPE